MAEYNKLSINFNQNILIPFVPYSDGQKFSFKYLDNNVQRTIEYTFKTTRTRNNEVSIATEQFQQRDNFNAAFIADYGNMGFNIDVDLLQIYPTTVINLPGEYINPNITTFIQNSGIIVPPSTQILFGYSFVPVNNGFYITSVETTAQPSDVCGKSFVVFETNVKGDFVNSPVYMDLSENPNIFQWNRGSSFILTVVKGNVSSSINVTTPPLLDVNKLELDIVNTPFSNNLNINSQLDGLILEYSLDGVNWSADNYFNGLTDGEYTLYVRDQYGCQKTKPFEITENGIYYPFFYISKSNSIRFANRVNFDDAGNFKNDENTLSCESDVLLPYMEVQQFQSSDVITTQFKSNYATNTAVVIDNGVVTEYPVVKKSNNIGLRDARDARLVSVNDTQCGIYFASGNTYDYYTEEITGNYTLNGAFPTYGRIGNFISIDNQWFLIQDIFFEEILNVDLLIINKVYTGLEMNIIVKSIYNLFDYEVYEFTIDFDVFINKRLRVKINATDPNFTNIELLSEYIDVKVYHPECVEIRYFNNENNDMFYQTGIKNLIRIPLTKMYGKDDEDSESYKTDTTGILLNSEIYETNVYVFEPVTKEIWRKLKIALSCENVEINGVNYIKNNGIETEGALDDTNLYVVTATMLKVGNVNTNKYSGFDFDTSNAEIPALIKATNDFLKYK